MNQNVSDSMMNRLSKRFSLSMLLCLIAFQGIAQLKTTIPSEMVLVAVDSGLGVFEDPTNQMTFLDVANQSFDQLEGISPYRGIRLGAIWIKFEIQNDSDLKQLVLLLEEPVLDRVELFQVNGEFLEFSTVIEKSRPFQRRIYDDPNYIYNLDIQKGDTRTIYLKINSKSIIHVPIFIGTTQMVLEKLKVKTLWYFIYIGLMIGLILYNLFIFLSTGQKINLLYLIYMLAVLLTQISVQGGYAFQYLWPNVPYMATHSVFIFPVLSGIAAAEFVRSFLNTKKSLPVLDKLFWVFEGIYLSCLIGSIVGFEKISYRIIEINAIGISFFLILVGVILYRRGNREAKFFLLAWSFFLGGIVLFIFKEVGVLPYNNWTKYSMPVGSAIEGLLLSLALADRLNFFKRAKEKAEEETAQLFEKFKQKLIKEQSLERENYELQMTNLRSQMNPHFVFNSLGSIQYYIQTNKVEEADEYLTKFAQLMRSYLDSSVENEISIRKEVSLLRDYISLEQMRFDKKFSLEIEVDGNIDQDEYEIPTMLIQPIVENAINHGLQARADDLGELRINFIKIGEDVQCVVQDNGVGLNQNVIKNKKSHVSRSTQNIKDRVVTLRNLGRADIEYVTREVESGTEYPGTEVVVVIREMD